MPPSFNTAPPQWWPASAACLLGTPPCPPCTKETAANVSILLPVLRSGEKEGAQQAGAWLMVADPPSPPLIEEWAPDVSGTIVEQPCFSLSVGQPPAARRVPRSPLTASTSCHASCEDILAAHGGCASTAQTAEVTPMPNVAQSTGSITPVAKTLTEADRTTAKPTAAEVASPLIIKPHCARPQLLCPWCCVTPARVSRRYAVCLVATGEVQRQSQRKSEVSRPSQHRLTVVPVYWSRTSDTTLAVTWAGGRQVAVLVPPLHCRLWAQPLSSTQAAETARG